MCGRYSLTEISDELLDRFEILTAPDFRPRYNIAPTQAVPVIRAGEDGANEIADLRWGLVPSWAATMDGPPLINARAESIAHKPSFKESFERRRCLVPADGYYEWRSEGGYRQPYHIRLRSREVFLMAGLWDTWTGRDGSLRSFAIITTEANPLTAPVHNRMPVILDRSGAEVWLDPGSGSGDLPRLLVPFPSGQMELEAVDTAVNNTDNDSAACLRPAEVNLDLGL